MIVRELVTKLGFKFDRTNLDKFEKSIIGFKTKFSIAAASVGGLIKKVYDFGEAFANSVNSAKNLADYTGLALSEFKQLQLAVNKFNVDESTFNNVFQNIALGIKEASVGVNNFVRQLTYESLGIVNFRKLNGELATAKDVFLQISNLIKTIPERSEQLRIISNIPGIGVENAGNFLDFLLKSNVEIERLISNEKMVAMEIEKSAQSSKDFLKSSAELNTEAQKLGFTLGNVVIPYFSQALQGVNAIVNGSSDFGGGIKGFLLSINEAFKVGVDDLLGAAGFRVGPDGEKHESISMLRKRLAEEDTQFYRALREQEIGNSSNNTVQANFEFNVAAGTTEEQANYISEKVQLTLSNFKDELVREVINNNPTVE